ncbi:cupin-like domain-containing protein [Asticcacaulis sp. EMRT-3]|uniref:cupin-like domain-containing protein n=1 Tax=Asticcacaulis sp. EMRT-3 TaxID=3040349 RepID=UPI0024AFFDAB|nr:cupin-like domain-containing protein [Asticcacaulis sp. EMRT-3]MDI7774030.1 cupin-like domain-containing protein [Asticcacaulis sp. EMRT-3]
MTAPATKVMAVKATSLEEINFAELIARQTPMIFKGLAVNLPMVQAGLASRQAVMDYLRPYYQGKPLLVFRGEPSIRGRFSYNGGFDGFNFSSERMSLDRFLDLVGQCADDRDAPSFYMGSTDLDTFFPGLLASDGLPLTGDMFTQNAVLKSIWLGNRTTACAHFDISHNLAVCMAGHRRFTLFKPDQIANLYPGPLEPTPGGQVISLVDFTQPDFEAFPRFKEALASAQVAELEPGDVLFYPSMWWHQVEALDSFNILINYWWNTTPAYVDTPMNTLLHGLLSLRERPAAEKAAWRAVFDYYLFGPEDTARAHIPPHAQGDLAPLDASTARRLRAMLLNRFNR